MVSDPGRGRDLGRDDGDDDLTAGPPPFSDEGMRRIIYGTERGPGRARDSRSEAFAEDTAELEAELKGRRNLVPIVTALAAVVCFAAIVWYAYTWGTGQMASDQLPVVSAQPMPEKVKPDQPGGMDVPHQGIAVLNNGSDGAAPQAVERLLPRPEIPQPPQPLPPPLPPQSAEAIPLPPQPEPPATTGGNGQDLAGADITGAPEEQAPAETADGIPLPVPKPAPGAASQGDQIANLLQQEPLETANGDSKTDEAAAAEPVPAQPAAQTPTQTASISAGDVVLQLSSVTSEAAAAAEWKHLQAAHPDLLGSRGFGLEIAEVKGTKYYRVQTGPFPNREAAADLCTRLKAQHQDCLVKQR